MQKLFPIVAAFLLSGALLLQPQAPQTPEAPAAKGEPTGKGGGKGKGKGGGGGFKNVQVLNPGTLPETMQSFVQALGLLDQGACSYCHVEDRSSDEKVQKVIARRMIIMARAINGTFPDGQQHVTCYTCHRGSTKPPMAP